MRFRNKVREPGRALPVGEQWRGIDVKGSGAATRRLGQRRRGHFIAEQVQRKTLDEQRARRREAGLYHVGLPAS